MREGQGQVFLRWRVAMVAGVEVVRDHSTPGRGPERRDKFLVLDGGGGGAAG